MSRRTLAATALSLTVLAGCSGVLPAPATETRPVLSPASPTAGSTAPLPSTASTAHPATGPTDRSTSYAALEETVRVYVDAHAAGDADTAFDRLWSERCQADPDARGGFAGTMLAQSLTDPDSRPTAGEVAVDAVEADVARVTYESVHADGTTTVDAQLWVLEDGHWRYDDC